MRLGFERARRCEHSQVSHYASGDSHVRNLHSDGVLCLSQGQGEERGKASDPVGPGINLRALHVLHPRSICAHLGGEDVAPLLVIYLFVSSPGQIACDAERNDKVPVDDVLLRDGDGAHAHSPGCH